MEGLTGTQQNIAQELMEEDLKRELERNEAATKMAFAKEQEAHDAKRRAQEAQVMMKAMLTKYEDMKNKLDGAKKELETTSTRIQHQEEITEKIQGMKDRIEAYSNRKEAVSHLQDHVQMKCDLQLPGMEFLRNTEAETARFLEVQKAEEGKAVRVAAMQEMMREREKAIEKTDKIKVMLERQLEIGEKRAAEQNRIASVREKLLELKMKELQLQKAKFERKKKEQEEKEKATEDFIAMIDQQLEKMEANVDPITGTVPKQLKMDLEAMGDKLLTNFSSKPVEDKVTVVQPVLEEPRREERQTTKTESIVAQTETDKQEETPVSAKNAEQGKDNSSEQPKPKNKKNKKKNKNKNRKARSQSRSEEVQSPKPEPEPEPEKVSPDVVDVSEEETPKEKLTEEEVKDMVAKVEGKCKNIKDNIADMAMSEQYLRTKQAMLKAKKREQEMKIAQKMAELREEEVIKMREKVARMQELLSSRKTELKITEEIIHEKDGEKENLEKRIEATRRRESYVEKKIFEKVMFEKPAEKK